MKYLIVLLCTVFSLGVFAGEKPKQQLGGGKILGVARIVGLNGRVIIISCDKSQKVCLYVLKKATEESEDVCKVSVPWAVPVVAESQFNYNYPYAFSFDTGGLTFYPATSIQMGCRNEEGDVQIKIETEAQVRFP